MADLTDRHYALFANNQHPIQLATYDEYNRFLQDLHDRPTAEREEATCDAFRAAALEREELLNTEEGESLSMEDLSDIYFQVKGAARARNNMSYQTRSKTGEIADYLEVRRPFGSAQ